MEAGLDQTIESSRLSHSTVAGSSFPPVADYGFISDCQVTALIAPSGNVEWLCLPRMDSPSIFAAILDRHAGRFRIGPADVNVPAGRRYLPGTMVLETTWDTPTGWAVVRDVLLIGPWRNERERSSTHHRVPTDHTAEGVLLRTVRCLSGSIDFLLECEPAFEYGRRRGTWRHIGEGYGQAEVTAGEESPVVRLTTDLNLGFEGARAIARRRLRAGDEVFCALSWGDGSPPQTFAEAHGRLSRTGDFWHEWVSRGRFPDHPWRTYLQRSALTLKGLIYAPTGALLAAATSSLPETLGGERNYDYRYSWLRDSTFMLWGLYTLGFDREAGDFFYFITDLAEGAEDLQIMYGIGGERELTEKTLDHLSGYEGSRPVRVGNGAWDQRQHDVWGVLLDSVYLHTRSSEGLDERRWPMLERQVNAALAHWQEPDQGIWEVRGPPQHFTASKVLCWVAADRGAKLAELRGDQDNATRWRRAADEIHADICEHGTDKRGVFCQHYATTALRRFAAADAAPRFLAARRPAGAGDGPGHRRRTDGGRAGAPLSRRRDRRRLQRRRGHLHDLFFLACLGIGRDWRSRARSCSMYQAPVLRQRASPLRRGDRSPHEPAPRQLPSGFLAPGADQRSHAPDLGGRTTRLGRASAT